MYRQRRFRNFRARENLRNRISGPQLPQKFVKGDGNRMLTFKKIAVEEFVELTLLLGEDEPCLKINFCHRVELKVRG